MDSNLAKGFRALNAKEAAKIIGCHYKTLLQKTNPNSPIYDPTFPEKLIFGPKSFRWSEEEIIEWAKSKKFTNKSFNGGYDE
jgi:prophage regulatory protein